MNIIVTDYIECPMLVGDGENSCGVACPVWYKVKKGGISGGPEKGKRPRRPRKCPAKEGINIKLKL